jgi:hypothetical protein
MPLARSTLLAFLVGAAMLGSLSPRASADLPFVDSIRFLPKPVNGPPEERPICPGDSIVMLVTGHFPSDCYEFLGITPVVFVREAPPTFQIVVNRDTCTRPCIANVIIPWRASVTLPPLPVPAHLPIDVWLSEWICREPLPPDTALQAHLFFLVDSCGGPPPPPPGCLRASMHEGPPDHCDATIAKNQPARVTLRVGGVNVALAGLQGSLRVSDGLRISGLEPVGTAAGMRIRWEPSAQGADFVMFAEHGAPIPPTPPDTSGFGGIPVLRVTVELNVRRPSDLALVTPLSVFGSDAAGNLVPECPGRPRLDVISARICSERDCDFNGDGAVDVRDLVLMAHCITGETPCPAVLGFDCNRDSTVNLDDVLCCAGRILGRDRCPDCRPDSIRRERDVRLSFGAPTRTASGVDLPVRLEGAYRIGGARLALGYPAERYDVASIGFASAQPGWLELHQVRDDRAVVGLIRLDGDNRLAELSPEPLDLVLHLALRPGRSHGGAVTASDFEFSGPDGVMLDVDLGSPSRPLTGQALTLSPSQPNPFSGETRFALTLEQSADVEVGIYDLSGRRVTTVFRGPLEPGTRSFGWNGRDAQGSTVSDGIYFYRAAAAGEVAARKLVLLRRN